MYVFSEKRIGRNIFEHIVCPAHIPFEVKAETSVRNGLCHHRPRRRFLRYHQRIRKFGKHGGVQFFEKRHRLVIVISAVNIRYPFAGRTVVVQIQHGRNRVDTEPVYMVISHPEKRVGYKKRLNLRSADVKATRSPGLMLHSVLALIFIKRITVKLEEPVLVLREVSGHPVKNDAYPRFVELVYKIYKVLRRAEARCRRVITADLISPRPVKRVLGYWHKLNVRIAHIKRIRHKLVRNLAVIEIMLSVDV